MAKTGREKFGKFRVVIKFLVAVNSVLPRSVNGFLLRFFRNTTGTIGLLIRYVLVRNLSRSCGDNVSIHPNVFLFNLKHVEFGSNISIHPMCYIDGAGTIKIGNNVSIAHNTSVLSTNHTWDNPDLPIKYNPETHAMVIIRDDVWIGCGCRILAGVTLASRVAVAAGAVVTADAEPGSLYGGIPARLLKKI
jgi:acetyltransferase-like isoleucine patch superfamily enzyme